MQLGAPCTAAPTVWSRLWSTRIPELLWNTLSLATGVAVTTLLLGVSLAWIIVRYEFPGRRIWEWALAKRSLIVFLMIVAVVAGSISFMRLGRGEDPAFTFRTMVVGASWPGATVEETLNQVTERLERTLQETDHLDRVRSYTTAGQTTIFVDLKQSTPPKLVPDIWYQVRKNIGDMRGTLPAGVIGPGFNDDFGSTFGIIYAFTADGFSFRELRDYVEAARSRLLHVPDVSKIEVLGAQEEQIFIEFSTERLAGLRLDYPTILATLQAQNLVRPAGTIQTGQERVFLRVSGSFDSEQDIESVNIVAGDRIFRLGDIATHAAEPDLVFDLSEHLHEPGHIGRVSLHEIERNALRTLGTNSGESAELVDEVLHDAFKHPRRLRCVTDKHGYAARPGAGLPHHWVNS